MLSTTNSVSIGFSAPKFAPQLSFLADVQSPGRVDEQYA
jgi:hypothetical protein